MAKKPKVPPAKDDGTSSISTAGTSGTNRATRQPARKKVTPTRVAGRRSAPASGPAGTSSERRGVLPDTQSKAAKVDEAQGEVMRKVVEDPNLHAQADEDWGDRTIVVIETREDAVVTKRVRVAEEITLRKEISERVETIRDTVRKHEVEIERIDAQGRVIREVAPPGTGH